MTMELETARLILRPWNDGDADDLYRYACDPAVGPVAGWPVHRSVEHSRAVIGDVLSKPETYAVVPKRENHAVGSIGLMVGKASNLGLPDSEGEIGYWIGVPFWGKGMIPEAVGAMIRHAFDDLHLGKLWCGYFEGNDKSRRVQEKCGFVYHHTKKEMPWPLLGDIRTEHFTCLRREAWNGYLVRTPRQDEIPLLQDFLYDAIFVPEGTDPPARDIVLKPELSVFVDRFGTRPEDRCLVADVCGQPVGAVWTRIVDSYGYLDDETPVVSISVRKEWRGKGIGTRLMQRMLELLGTEGCRQVSLSVQKANPAVNLYRKTGFEIVGETAREYVMACRILA
jgi:RimJ/RimL family protein N-acetyltransferase